MKQEKFIELLNLYLDGELKSGEAADLEREILHNPERRRIYRQYCRMQRACTVLADRFRDDSVPSTSLRGDQVIEFPRRTWQGPLQSVLMIAAGAAAACVVFVAVRASFFRANATASMPVAAAPAVVGPAGTRSRTQPAHTVLVAHDGFALFENPWDKPNAVNERMGGFQSLGTTAPLLQAAPPLPVLRPAPNSLQFEFQSWPSDGRVRIDREHRPAELDDPELSAFQFQR